MDEINRLRETITNSQTVTNQGKREYKDTDELFDLAMYLFETAYINGTQDAAEQINTLLGYDFLDTTFDPARMSAVINQRLADGKDWHDRLQEHFDNGDDVETVMRVLESESNRDANTGSLDKAWDSGMELTKTWETMLDDKVRDTHAYLEGITVGVHDLFFTDDGDYADAPGGFNLASNNVNCRCTLRYGLL